MVVDLFTIIVLYGDSLLVSRTELKIMKQARAESNVKFHKKDLAKAQVIFDFEIN